MCMEATATRCAPEPSSCWPDLLCRSATTRLWAPHTAKPTCGPLTRCMRRCGVDPGAHCRGMGPHIPLVSVAGRLHARVAGCASGAGVLRCGAFLIPAICVWKSFTQVSAPKTKFLGNSVEVYPIGESAALQSFGCGGGGSPGSCSCGGVSSPGSCSCGALEVLIFRAVERAHAAPQRLSPWASSLQPGSARAAAAAHRPRLHQDEAHCPMPACLPFRCFC